MKLHLGKWSFTSATLLSLLVAACSSKNTGLGDGTGNGGGAATGNTSSGNGGSANGATGAGGRAPSATGGMPTAPSGTGGVFTYALGKACQGILDTTAAAAGSGSTTDADAGAQCSGVGAELEPSPLDMFIMMDRSMSMTYVVQNTNIQRWDVLKSGLTAFINDPNVIKKAPRVGLGYFSATGNPNDPKECDPNVYAQPTIEMEPIATGGPKIIQSVTDEYALLGGQTATLQALWGALKHAQAWQVGNPRMTVVVLVTDGYPTECGNPVNTPPDMSLVTQVAKEYFTGVVGDYNSVGTPSIRSYIIGVAVDKFNLDAVAQAGGTNAATIVDSTAAVSQFVTAMVNITNANINCTFKIPPPPLTPDGLVQVLDPRKVQVVYKPFQGTNQQIPLADSGSCGGPNGGWFFDNPTDPKTVTLCPCSCANLGAGSIEFRFGCFPPIAPVG